MPRDDIEERIRDILTVWAGKILDYAHRDYYELVRFYYRKRVEAFLDHAEANLAARRPSSTTSRWTRSTTRSSRRLSRRRL